MTTPDDPSAKPPGEPHHGVVETLREELEEVVEHVPQPVRWTVGKIVRLSLLALAALLVLLIVSVVLYLTNRTELVARETAILLNQTLASRSNVALELRDLRGNPLTGFRAVSPRVRFREGGDELLMARELRLSYPAWNLFRGGRGPVEATLVEPVIRITRDATGQWRLPTWKGGPSRGAPRMMDVHLRFERARILLPAPYDTLEGLDFDALATTGGEPVVQVRSLTWKSGPWGSQLAALSGRYVQRQDSTRVTLERLRTQDVDVRGTAAWLTASKIPERRLDVRVERVRWRWLAKVFDNGTLDVPGEGAGTIRALGNHDWRGGFASEVTWDSLAARGTGRFAWDGQVLTLDSLRGQSLAGNLEGRLRWTRQGWDISGEARDADPAHWDALHLHGWPTGRLNGWFRYGTDTRGEHVSRLDSRLIASEWTGWQVDSARVRIDFPAVAADSFGVVGYRRGGRFTLAGRIGANGWSGPYTLADFPLEEWPDGRASGLRGTLTRGEGRVENRDDQLFVTGTLEGGVTDWSAAHFAAWRLDDVNGRLLPTPALTARATATDGFFVGLHVDSARAHVELGDETIAFPDLAAMAGDTTFAGAGHADWHADLWHVDFAQASVRSSQLDWTVEPPMRLSGDPRGVITERLVAHDAEGRIDAQGRWASPGGSYDFTAQGSGVDLARIGFPPEWGLAGRAAGVLRVSGASGDPRWTFRGGASAPGFNVHAADSLSIALNGSLGRLDVEDIAYRLGAGTARGSMLVESMAPWPDSLTGTAILRWIETARSWRGDGRAQRLPLERLVHAAPRAIGWGGALSGRVQFAGAPHTPTFTLEAAVDSLSWREYQGERFELRAHYADGKLDVPQADLVMLGVTSTARGELPLELALGRSARLPELPMRWTLQVPRGDLQLLPLLVPQIQAARGRFDVDAVLAGTASKPRLSGSGHVRDGTIRPAGRQEVLEGLYADLHFDEAAVTLDTLSARQGRAGSVIAQHGSVRLDGMALRDYRFDLTMRNFTAAEEGLYAVLFDGDFVVTDGPRVAGVRLPQVTGDVRVERGVIELDFANQSTVEQIAARTQPLYWTYRIHLDATNNLRWRPPDGELEFDANLDLEQTPDSLLIYGEMHSLHGTYFFLSNRFNVTRADLVFDNQNGVDPLLDVSAVTQVKVVNGRTSSNESITATISGRASTPTIGLEGPPGWDQQQILAELTYLRFGQGSEGQFRALGLGSDPFDNYLTQQLNRQLSREMSDFFRGAISEWEVERDQGGLFTGSGDFFVRVGAQVTPQLALRYGQRVGSSVGATPQPGSTPTSLFERDVEAEYRLSRFIYLTTELAQRRQQSGTSSGADFNLNLKARWEY